MWCARNLIEIDEDFAVLLADEMVLNPGNGLLKQMVNVYNEVGGANIIAAGAVPMDQVSKYGILNPLNKNEDENNVIKLKDMVEKPKPDVAPSNLSITGRYILNAKVFEYLDKGHKSVGGEIQLTDSMQAMLKDGYDFYGLKFEGKRFDCGNRLGFLEANIAYALERDDMHDRVKAMLNKYK